MPLSDHAAPLSLVIAYGATCMLLCLNILILWIASGDRRAKGGIAINPEDARRYNVPVSSQDSPAVARILRAHRNAEAVIYPFLLLGVVYVVAGGSTEVATPIFATFVVARVSHSGFYLAAMQPWRTISFGLSLLATLALFLADGWILARLLGSN